MHYRQLTEIINRQYPNIDYQKINATCSGDRRFESDNRGNWWIIGRSDRELKIKQEILSLIKTNSKPLYTPQINYQLYLNNRIKLHEESLPRRILMGNNFVRWGTSDYWTDKAINLPTSNISSYYREQIKNFFTRFRQPLTRESLARVISSLTGIYIKPDSGFSAEISRLIKEKYLKNLGHSVITTRESSFQVSNFNLKDMLYTVLQRNKYPLNLSEIKNKLAEDFNHDIPETSISSALVEDTRFVHQKNHYWAIIGFTPPQAEMKNTYKSGKKINSNKITASSLLKGSLPVDPEMSKIFPAYQSQVLFKTETETYLVNYNFENRTLENLNKLYTELQVKKGDMLGIQLSDINLKVYQVVKISTQDSSYQAEQKTKLLIPGISNHDLIYNFKDIISNFTSPDNQGKILFPLNSWDLSGDLSILLAHGKRNVEWEGQDKYSQYWLKLIGYPKSWKIKLSRFSRTWWRNEQPVLQQKLRWVYNMDNKCPKCSHPLYFLDHIWGTLSYRVICSNKICRNASLRNALKLRLDLKQQYKFNQRINEKNIKLLNINNIFDQTYEQRSIRSFLSPYCLIGLDLLLKSIVKEKNFEHRLFLFLTWAELLKDCLNNVIMLDKNILIYYNLKLKSLMKSLLNFQYTSQKFTSLPDFTISYHQSTEDNIKQEICSKVFDFLVPADEEMIKHKTEQSQYQLKPTGKYFLVKNRNLLDPEHQDIINNFKLHQLALIHKYTAVIDNSDVLVFEKK